MAETYKYYILGSAVPVRVVFTEHEGRPLKRGAQVPDTETQSLKYDGKYLSRIETSYEVEEIDEKRFSAACAEIYARKKF